MADGDDPVQKVQPDAETRSEKFNLASVAQNKNVSLSIEGDFLGG